MYSTIFRHARYVEQFGDVVRLICVRIGTGVYPLIKRKSSAGALHSGRRLEKLMSRPIRAYERFLLSSIR